ncbi:AsmA family protein [Phaeobacter sp.]|uniref:AsmA family protein n=1 Tax=Phaeobacter sp. TaxID=1902409 RepID=UPI0025E18F29|nr:AsmA family protein [Phaeobacter sp.]
MRLILRIVTGLVVAVVLLIGGLLLLPGEKLAQLAADQIEAQTGRSVTFGGRVGYSLWPTLGVKADRVALSNVPWAGDTPMLTAERLTIGIDAADLIRGTVRVTELSAVLPQLFLTTNAEGVGNWVLGPSDSPQPPADSSAAGASDGVLDNLPISIEALTLTGATLRYAPHEAEAVELRQVDLALAWPDPSGTVEIDATLRPAGSPIRITGEIGTFEAFLAGQVASVAARLSAPGVDAQFDGRADLSGAATGRVTSRSTDLAGALAALGLDLGTAVPVMGELQVGADVTYTPDGRLALRDLSAAADANQIVGDVDIVLGDKPTIAAQLSAGSLDLAPFLQGSPDTVGASAAATPASSGWSNEPIDLNWLSAFDANVVLDVDAVDTGSVLLGSSKLDLSVDNARAVLKLVPATLFGGQVQGQIVANNRNGLSVGGKLSFQGVRVEELLGQTAGYDRLNGEALGELEYLGVGNSVADIMASLSGKGWIEVGKGFFTGFDLEQLMRSGSGNGGSTVFDQLTGSYTIADGNLMNSDLLVTLRGLRAEGKGRIGLGAQDLDYLFTPTLQGGGGEQILSIPVAITGPWSDPKIRPDLQQALQPQIDAVEEEAKDRLREKLSEELDTEIAPEQDLNDAIRDRIEQEAKEQLLRLLGGD